MILIVLVVVLKCIPLDYCPVLSHIINNDSNDNVFIEKTL